MSRKIVRKQSIVRFWVYLMIKEVHFMKENGIQSEYTLTF